MKKICFFNSSNFWGGGEKLHLENAVAFRNKGYDVVIVAHQNGPLWKLAIKEGFSCFPISVKSTSFLSVFKLLKLKKYFIQESIDTVIFTTSQDAKIASIAARLARLKRIVYLRGLAIPIKNSLVNRYCLGTATTHIIANSDETKRTILQNLNHHISADRVAVIYHGIERRLLESTGATHPHIKAEGKGIILGNAGRLTEQKGQILLLEVAQKLKKQKLSFTLFIAGTGELHDKLSALIIEKDLQQEVVLLGFVDDMSLFMQSIDVFLLSSSWEGFGFVIVEAMAKEKPVVAFNITSNPEIITNNKTGLLANRSDTTHFSEQTAKLITDKNLRTEMGLAAKQSVIDRFLITDRVTELEKHLVD